MNQLRRREVIAWGLTGYCALNLASTEANQKGTAPVSGRILFLGTTPGSNPQALCTLIGTGNARITGQFDSNSGEFSFSQIPPGSTLLLQILFNSQAFEYRGLDTKFQSRLEIRLYSILSQAAEEATDKKDAKKLMTAMGVESLERLRSDVLRAVNGFGTFGLDYNTDAALRQEFTEIGGPPQIARTLKVLSDAVETVLKASDDEKAAKPENRLLRGVFSAVREMWTVLR